MVLARHRRFCETHALAQPQEWPGRLLEFYVNALFLNLPEAGWNVPQRVCQDPAEVRPPDRNPPDFLDSGRQCAAPGLGSTVER